MKVAIRAQFHAMIGAILLATGLLSPSPPVLAACKIEKVELAVTVVGRRFLVPANINGMSAKFIVDSGAFFSMIAPEGIGQYSLSTNAIPYGAFVTGLSGTADARVAKVKTFTLANTAIPDVDFLVTGREPGEGAVGALGQNFLGQWDVDYDLANNVIRLMTPIDCGDRSLAYWAGEKPFSILPIEHDDRVRYVGDTKAKVLLNGASLTALLDTGAPVTVLSLKAASRAGLTPNSPGVSSSGPMRGIGQRIVQSWVAKFQSFKIGGEEARNVTLRFGDFELENADMILGADFFLSHHIYVSNKQKKMYFTYNGGPFFDAR